MKEMQREKQKSLEESQASLSTKERDVERKVTQRLTGMDCSTRSCVTRAYSENRQTIIRAEYWSRIFRRRL